MSPSAHRRPVRSGHIRHCARLHIFPIARPVPPANLAILAVLGISVDYYRLMEHSQVNIAYGAHLGGFLVGLLFACFVVPRPKLAESR